jgi:hypothetical protein
VGEIELAGLLRNVQGIDPAGISATLAVRTSRSAPAT